MLVVKEVDREEKELMLLEFSDSYGGSVKGLHLQFYESRIYWTPQREDQ